MPSRKTQDSLAKQNDPRQNDILERMATLEREMKELRRRDSVEDQPQENKSEQIATLKREQLCRHDSIQEQPQEIKSANTQILHEALVKDKNKIVLKPGESWNPCDADNQSIMSEEEVEFPGCNTSATAPVKIDEGLDKKCSTTRHSWDPQDWDIPIMSVEEITTHERTASTPSAVEKVMPPVQEFVTPESTTTQQVAQGISNPTQTTTQQVEEERMIGGEDTMFLQQSFGNTKKNHFWTAFHTGSCPSSTSELSRQ